MNPLDNPNKRPRYTISMAKSPHVFTNYEDFPFAILRQMQWDKTNGFSELAKLSPPPITLFHVTDWASNRIGAIKMVVQGRNHVSYFWEMYQAEYGADKQPHVLEHYWIESPYG